MTDVEEEATDKGKLTVILDAGVKCRWCSQDPVGGSAGLGRGFVRTVKTVLEP